MKDSVSGSRYLAYGLTVLSIAAFVVAFLFGSAIGDKALSFSPLTDDGLSLVAADPLFFVLISPAITLCSTMWLIGPGAVAYLGIRRPETILDLALGGTGVGLIAMPVFVLLIGGVAGEPLTTLHVFASGGILMFLGLVLLNRQEPCTVSWVGGRAIVAAIALVWLLIAVLAPKIYFEAFNGDGAHALESTIRIIRIGTPFWPAGSEEMNDYPTLNTLINHVPSTLFALFMGESEPSVRLVGPVGTGLLFLALCRLSMEVRGQRHLPAVDLVLIASTLVVFAVSLSYSGSYEQYADMAMPFAREVFFCAMFIAAFAYIVSGRFTEAAVFSALSIVSLPTGGPLILFFTCLVFLFAGEGRRVFLAKIAIFTFAAMLFVQAWGLLLYSLGWPVAGFEFDVGSAPGRIRFLSLVDFERLPYLFLPVAIVPVLAAPILLVRGSAIVKILVFVGLCYALFFYTQGFRSLLHHMVPACAILLAAWCAGLSGWMLPRYAWGVGVLLALFLVRPSVWDLEHTPQRQAAAIWVHEDLRGDYGTQTVLDLNSAITEFLPYVPYVDRFEKAVTGNDTFAANVYARRGWTDRADAAILICPAGLCDEVPVSSFGDLTVHVISEEKLAAAATPPATTYRLSPMLWFAPEKTFRSYFAVREQTDRLIDSKELLLSLLGR